MEYFDVCDENGVPTGERIERTEAHRLDVRHRTAHIWVVRQTGGRAQVLLQKRSRNKDSYPGKLDVSSAGHIRAGDEPLVSALRELEEELGIRAEEKDLRFIGRFDHHYEAVFSGRRFRDNECSYVFVYQKDVDIEKLKLQEEEVERVLWRDLCEVRKAVAGKDNAYCVPTASLELVAGYLASRENAVFAGHGQTAEENLSGFPD